MREGIMVRDKLVRSAILLACLAGPAAAQTSAGEPPLDPAVIEELVLANRIVANEGVVDAFGHVSIRDPRNPNRYLQSRSLPPYLVSAKDILVLDLDSRPVDPEVKCGCYLERFIHGEIYKARPDVNAVIHTHSATVVPFSVSGATPLRPLLHNAAFLPPTGAPVFDIYRDFGATNMLVQNPDIGKALARSLGDASVVLLRGHGDAVVGGTLKVAVWRAYYTEIDARMLVVAKTLGEPIAYLHPDEAAVTDKEMQGTPSITRAWEQWKNRLPK
jgi:HCOMODA/2-hydroxy-3-carboxy-muconic semialdehyde decarboxylase